MHLAAVISLVLLLVLLGNLDGTKFFVTLILYGVFSLIASSTGLLFLAILYRIFG